MAQWLVNRGDSQFTVDGLADLKRLAQKGDLDAGDLIQPDGASDWLYAIEIPDLDGLLKADVEDDDIEFRRRGGAGAMKAVLYALFSVMLIGGIGGMLYFYGQLPQGDESLLGEGGALKYTDIIAVSNTQLLAEPEEGAKALESIPKDAVMALKAKRGGYYRAETKGGTEGWVAVDDILAVYTMGDDKVRRKMDPLYNPDQYTKVGNAAWGMMDQEGNTTATFRFSLENTSMYDMTDLVLEATIKDSTGTEVGTKEFAIGGVIPADSNTMVGTLPPPEDVVKAAEKADEEPPPGVQQTYYTFEQETKALPEGEAQEERYLRWLDGVEIEVEDNFVEATVRIVELRAVPVE